MSSINQHSGFAGPQFLLDHQSAYVRSSVAVAIGKSVEQWPQSIQANVMILQEYYREKVCGRGLSNAFFNIMCPGQNLATGV